MVALAAPLLTVYAAARKKTVYVERFTAAAHSLVIGQTSRVEIGISRWSTPEEREVLLEAVKNTGPADFQNTLRRVLEQQELCGFFRFRNTTAVNIRYARQVPTEGGGRNILLVAERPIHVGEVARMSRSFDYMFSVMQLELDEDDRGEGALALGVEIIFNPQTNSIEMTKFSTQPVRLVGVRPRR
jgi:hypothetical protein